ncbi:unnamed protein product [Urochloa decumbens]|uniref:Xylanase inhibitor C-terminal domain-containing protein n=1 Tax=Urochloa decumbens TaxID=240449 RepID=A0ABC8ZDN9_9POAL
MKMPRPTPPLLLAISLLVLAWPASCADPVLFPVSKDAATSLYSIPVRDGANHVVDLAGPLLWSTCARDHLPAKLSCKDPVCKLANAYRAPSCRIAGRPCKKKCTAYPYNPVTGKCAAAGLIHTRLVVGDLTTVLAFTALHTRKGNPLHYIPVQAIAVDQPPPVLLPAGGVVLCSRVAFTALRPDVYRPVVDAFDRGQARNDAKVDKVGPLELCYNSTMLENTRNGYAVPEISFVFEDGKRWTFVGSNSMVQVDGQTACLAFVEMKGVKAGDPNAAAVVVGGFQMENHLLQFDLEKKQLGFAMVPSFSECSNFDFTNSQY